tara:strand:+ start:314 stop:1549 length:1236 start_codon:yes stop_codon:yes gene_type:complete
MMKRGDSLPPFRFRDDFAPLREENPVCYLDNACTTLRPDSVVESITSYYTETPGCGGRSPHRWGTAVTQNVIQARDAVARFIGASRSEVIFTLNSTSAINQIARGIKWQKDDVVITSDKEHNSNLVPWLQLKRSGLIDHRIVNSNEDNTFNLESFEEACSSAGKNLRLVAVPHISNLDGVTNPLREICRIAHDYGAEVLADSAQSVPHQKTDVKELGCDYLAFSLHKMLGPSGIGVLYGVEDSLANLDTISGGGKTIAKADSSVLEFLDGPQKFEGGSSNYAGIIGAKAAIEYLENVDFEWLDGHEKRLNAIITEGVKDLDGVSIIGPNSASLRKGTTALTVEGIDVHDLAIILDEAGSIMVRSGFHCVNSWFDEKQISGGSLRTSAYLYNTEDEARHFVDLFEEAISALS